MIKTTSRNNLYNLRAQQVIILSSELMGSCWKRACDSVQKSSAFQNQKNICPKVNGVMIIVHNQNMYLLDTCISRYIQNMYLLDICINRYIQNMYLLDTCINRYIHFDLQHVISLRIYEC